MNNCNYLQNAIINIFIFLEKIEKNIINEYLIKKYKNIQIEKLKKIINLLIKQKYLFSHDNYYYLTEKGKIVLIDNIIYHKRIIVRFFRKIYIKYFKLKEIRIEQKKLRNFLLKNKPQKCIICDKFLPTCLLETAHLKPRFLLNFQEKNDYNIVEFMCRYCHSLYDNGYIAVNNGHLFISNFLKNNYSTEFDFMDNKTILSSNQLNYKYFNFHLKYIFKK